MRHEADRGRYDYLVNLIRNRYPQGSILDLGCGEGILQEYLGRSGYGAYLGVDFSDVAIANAQKLADEKTRFVVGDLDRLSVQGQWDVIIYNETLYYLRDPKGAVGAVLPHLAAGGVVVISMVDKHGKERTELWSKMEEILHTADKKKITNSNGDSWTIRVYQTL